VKRLGKAVQALAPPSAPGPAGKPARGQQQPQQQHQQQQQQQHQQQQQQQGQAQRAFGQDAHRRQPRGRPSGGDATPPPADHVGGKGADSAQ
jgi:transcription initiation factor TFIID subunit TAF12